MSFIVFGAPDGPGKTAEVAVRARLLWHRTIRSFGLYLGLGVGLIASIFIAVALIPTQTTPAPAPDPLPLSPWAVLERPFQMYGLSAAEFGREPTTFEAKRHREGRGRIDILTWGDTKTWADTRTEGEPGDDARPYLRLSIHRIGREPIEDSSFFIHMVREAASFGAAITRGNVAAPLTTRFGLFEAADVMLDAGGNQANCLGFRFGSPERLLRMTGFACGTAANPIDRQALACTLDRVNLISAGEDHDLARFFAAAQTRRDPSCTPQQTNSQTTIPANVQSSWIDQTGTAAPLRGVATKPRRR